MVLSWRFCSCSPRAPYALTAEFYGRRAPLPSYGAKHTSRHRNLTLQVRSQLRLHRGKTSSEQH